jgi:hypothetical protein
LKLIFLDVDGVLNSRERWIDCECADLDRSGSRIDPRAVDRLSHIVQATDAKIVVSSTWRLYYYEALISYLNHWPHLKDKVIGKTAHFGGPRGDEIADWIAHHEDLVENFVILDDDSDMSHLMTYLVKTTFQNGLQQEHVDECIRRLNETGS